MFSGLSSLFIFDYILFQFIPFCILLIACWAHKELEFEIGDRLKRRIMPYSNDQRLAMWIVGVIAAYFLLKLIIYNFVFATATAKIVEVDQREDVIAVTKRINMGRDVTIDGFRKVEMANPIFEMEVENNIVRFESERKLDESEIKVGNEFSFVYLNGSGEPLFVDFGGLYFFRHDITVLFVLAISLFWAWHPRHEEGWESGRGGVYEVPKGGIFIFALSSSMVLPIGVMAIMVVKIVFDFFHNGLFGVH